MELLCESRLERVKGVDCVIHHDVPQLRWTARTPISRL